MKALFLVALLAQMPAAAAQLPRADAYLVAGWQNLHQPQPIDHYNEWLNSIFYAGGGAGWYWNDHLKTQIDLGAGTRDHQYRTRQLVIDGVPAYEASRVGIREQNVSISQQYQFFRNQWFHPHVGAGVELARQSSTEEFQAVIAFDNVTRLSRQVSPARTEGPHHRFIARAFAETGFKTYMTRRSFFIGDMRLMFCNGVDQVLFRAGFGFDF